VTSSLESLSVDPPLPTVLIVDDVEANLVALRALLEGTGCNVTSASSGNQALRLLLRHEFAVMLLDVQMPEMDGYEVARHARMIPATRDIPIIFLTATHDSEENVLRGYGSGAVDFLFKPIDADVLRSKVRVFLELYSSRQKLADANLKLEAKNKELRALAEAEAGVASNLRLANEELQSAYRDLQAAQAQLVQSAKMASLGELVAGVAHEINNPLAFVMSHLDTVRKSLEQFRGDVRSEISPEGEHAWTRAHQRLSETELGLGRIRDLVLKLRTFSRLDEGERKRVSIAECVESVLTILQHRTKERIEVVTQIATPDLIDCYPALLNQVLLNLVANSIDAIEGPGTITIAAGARGDAFEITVSDSGAGIPAEVRERVLEPFFTTKPVGQGTGLGLSIAYSIMKKHDGSIELGDAPGGGTLATLRIPLQHAP
jgi:two-component system NtrC family sensor kinase